MESSMDARTQHPVSLTMQIQTAHKCKYTQSILHVLDCLECHNGLHMVKNPYNSTVVVIWSLHRSPYLLLLHG